jgi:hypothetical protein
VRVDGGPHLFQEEDMAGEAVDVGADGVVASQSGQGITYCCGTAPPAGGTPGYARGCLFVHVDATNNDTLLSINIGTNASSDFTPLALETATVISV